MATQSFGRRGSAPRSARPVLRASPAAISAEAAFDRGPPAHFDGATVQGKNLIADMPILTVGMIIFLMGIFSVEKRLAFDIGRDGTISVESLIAFGAVSYNSVVGSGEWWRVFLAPLLHASLSHLVGNSFALFCVGVRLEPMIGRSWFSAIFVVGALGGVAGSLYGSAPGIPGVGASGAITGLIGALFVVSFHHRADPLEQRAMRLTAMRFGIPALLPLAFGASGHVDYFAHAGGALAGGAVGLALWVLWPEGRSRPSLARPAAIASLIALATSIVACTFAASQFSVHVAKAAQLIPSSETPASLQAGGERSAELLTRYPKDPRSHLFRGYFLVKAHRLSAAEGEFRTAMDMAAADAVLRPTRDLAQTILAVIVFEQGRLNEAKFLAADMCRGKDQATNRGILETARLCD